MSAMLSERGGNEPSRATAKDDAEEGIELSVVMPCLNEADTIGACIRKAHAALAGHSIRGEVIVADNGSTDASREIALELGAQVVDVPDRGYGSALMGGIAAARGTYVLMGDADDSYDFGELPRFLAPLRQGCDLVQGCRLPSGGGSITPLAMPASHRWLGNPLFSWMARRWFGAPIHDVNCGLRAFRRDWQAGLGQRCTGMEFANEMIIKASLFGSRIGEVPITLHRDGRTSHGPHLRTLRDGWRTLRFYLLYSPRWLFLSPGVFLILLGIAAYALAMPATRIGAVRFDVNTLLFGSLWIICGYQAVLFAVMSKSFAIREGLMPPDPRFESIFRVATLERGIALGAVMFAAGVTLLGGEVLQWRGVGFGDLVYPHVLRYVIPGVTLTALGFQTVLSSFFISVLGMSRR